MNRILLIFVLLLATVTVQAQQLNQVKFSGGTTLTTLGFLTDQGVLIRITDDGILKEWGVEVRSLRGDWYSQDLQPFAGRVDYYGPEGDSISKGKVKMIGTCTITYYGPYEDATRKGKIRSIGTEILDYYSQFESREKKGKIKFAGSQMIEYYSAFENEAYRGKLKAVGSSRITYYSGFDDRTNSGKIKSIGPNNFSWYSNQDPSNMRGGLKSGLYRQRINGVTYIIW